MMRSKSKHSIKVLTLTLLLASSNLSLAAFNEPNTKSLAFKAASADAAEAAVAIAMLRAEGPAGLQKFLAAHDAELKAEPTPADANWQRLNAALDAVCGQRDCYASRLYWHTDLEVAKAAARASGKPILSLRLLGRLDEDLSCANSRFFRITLYANREVSRFLRENYVLHWKSVRPVPRVTIDFGDGRQLERTLTGNSIHYVLDGEGRPLDALPGLYGPRAFMRALSWAGEVAKTCATLKDKERENYLRQYHAGRVTEIAAQMAADFARAGAPLPVTTPVRRGPGKTPTAAQASRVAVTKMVVVERPLLRRLVRDRSVLDLTAEDAAWAQVGGLRLNDALLDENSKALMRYKNPEVFADPRTFRRAVSLLERSIAEDTARNEYLIRSRLHQWFADGQAGSDVDALNERVYSELFLTPGSDPWLGLLPADAYTGIEREGIKK